METQLARPGGRSTLPDRLVRASTIAGHALAAALRIGARVAVARARGTRRGWRSAGIELRRLCERLGPAYVKAGQILSTRHDLLPAELAAELAALQDRLTPVPLSKVEPLLVEQLGGPLDSIFDELDEMPLSAASIATVFRGRLHDGRPVALKVRRPGIDRIVGRDIDLLLALARAAERVPGLKALPLSALVAEVSDAIRRQLDFRVEATSCRRIAAAVASNRVRVPLLIDELCSESVITMELLDEVHAASPPAGSPAAIEVALDALYAMIFAEGIVHCDMHPGNLFLSDEDWVVLLDYGFTAELSRTDRLAFAEFFYALAENDGVRCAEITLEIAHGLKPGFDREAFTRDVAELVERASGSRAAEFQIVEFVGGLFDLQRRAGVHASTAFTMAIVSLLVLEGTARRIHPRLDFQGRARPYILRVLLENRRELPDGAGLTGLRPG